MRGRIIAKIRERAAALERGTWVLYRAYRDPRVSRPARLIIALVVGYAFSPIDLIPDFIPVLGYLDDLLLVPAGILLALRMIPPEVLAECRARVREDFEAGRRPGRWAAVVIVIIWLLLIVLLFRWLSRLAAGRAGGSS